MKTKFNLDRDKLNNDYIHSKQNYKKVLEGFKNLKPPIWKSPWFYGPVGLASLAVILVITIQSRVNAYGNNATLKNTAESTITIPGDTPCINAPFAEKKLAFQVFDVLPEAGAEIQLKSGTNISIPANSIQSENGSPVQIKIREFHDKASAFLAGIPMDYGKHEAFESAGMIEIRAEKEGKKISLDPSKPMDIALSLHKSPEGFQFWKLNEDKKEWIETPCIMKDMAQESLDKQLKAVDFKIRENLKHVDLCANEIAALPKLNKSSISNSNLIPTEKARKLIIDFDLKDFPELKGYKDMEFEYVLPENKSEASLNSYEKRIKYAQSQVWNTMNIEGNGTYYLATFMNDKEKYSLPIRPVLKGTSLTEMQSKLASASKEKEEVTKKLVEERNRHEKEQANLKREQEKLKAQLLAKIKSEDIGNMEEQAIEARKRAAENRNSIQQGTASFRTSSFGVFNCDRPISYPPEFQLMLAFETKQGYQVEIDNAFIFDLKKDTRYSFGSYFSHKINKIGWFNHESSLVIIDKQGDVYYRKSINEQGNNINKVIVEQLDEKALTLEGIKKIISETPIAV